MQAGIEFVAQGFVNKALTRHPAQARERFRHNAQSVVRLAAGARAGMPRMLG